MKGNAGADMVAAASVERDLAEIMDAYDDLPRAYRAVLRDAPINLDTVGIGRLTLEELHQAIARLLRMSTPLAYGDDHPDISK